MDLRVSHASKSFGEVSVLRDVDFAVPAGTFVVIVGPSGCGKTTLLRSLAGLEGLDAGSLVLGGRDVTELEPRDRDVAMVFQNYALYPTKSVYQNMAYGLQLRREPKAEIERRVGTAAKRLHIEHLLHRRPSQLSGGQRQRVAMGRAMVREPRLFLFDEPLSNLDAALRVELRVEIKRIQRALDVTTVYVTHDQQEAMTLADLLIVMRNGSIEQMGAPKAIYDEPATRFVASFLGTPPMAFLGATLEDTALTFEDGSRFELRNPPPGRTASGPVDVGIRPEMIAIGTGNGGSSLPARVDLVEELGASRLIHLMTGLGPLVANAPADGPQPKGDVTITLAMEKCALFDRATGMRISAS
jgi:sn-glycerol 3-phosphate transport system ATP-binding protein